MEIVLNIVISNKLPGPTVIEASWVVEFLFMHYAIVDCGVKSSGIQNYIDFCHKVNR